MPMRKLFNLLLLTLVVLVVAPAGGYAADDPSPPLTCMVSIGEQTPEMVASEIATLDVCPEIRVTEATNSIIYTESWRPLIRAGDTKLKTLISVNTNYKNHRYSSTYNKTTPTVNNTDKLPEIRRL